MKRINKNCKFTIYLFFLYYDIVYQKSRVALSHHYFTQKMQFVAQLHFICLHFHVLITFALILYGMVQIKLNCFKRAEDCSKASVNKYIIMS